MHKHVLLIQTHIIPEPLEMIILHSDTGTYSRRSRLNGYLKEIVAEENVAGAPGPISVYARPFACEVWIKLQMSVPSKGIRFHAHEFGR